MSTFKELVAKLNQELPIQFKFKLDMIHSSCAKVRTGNNIEFLGYADSISKDISIVPEDLIIFVSTNPQASNIVRWINEKIFTSMLNQTLAGMNTIYTTEFVRLRIAANLIEKLELNAEQKTEWIFQLNSVYYERKKVISEYYLKEIVEIPF